MNKCLVLSYGPVPTPEHDKVEGGGLRCWGLAKGLRANNADLDIVVAYNDSYKKDKHTSSYEGIGITTWTLETLPQLISEYDTVIVSYCMGDLSRVAARSVNTDQQLVLDCYVPIYVEISARQSDNLESEYASFMHETHGWAEVLRRGDVFLCANEAQKRFYQGVLSALGRVNPATYGEQLILVVPYGIYRDVPLAKSQPITNLLSKRNDKHAQKFKKVLWFGAIYPWFDLRVLTDAVVEANKTLPIKLIVVGAKNPFNNHPDFVQKYDQFTQYLESNPAAREHVIMQDWIEFSDRADWYLDSDAVILINKLGDENELAWRTRLVDYMWADLPILTNGGDPLSEVLIAGGAAHRLERTDQEGITRELIHVLSGDGNLGKLKKNITHVRDNYYWDHVTKELEHRIVEHWRPRDTREFGFVEQLAATEETRAASRLTRFRVKAKQLPGYYKKYGARNTYFTIRNIATSKIKDARATSPRVLFVSHQLDTTGAPLVLIDLVAGFKQANPNLPIEFHTFNPTASENIVRLNSKGIKPRIHFTKEKGLIYRPGDVVILNTIAFSNVFMDGLFDALQNGVVKKLIWYIHEDEPELNFESHQRTRIKKMLDEGKLTIYTPATRSTLNYQTYFSNKTSIKKQYYKFPYVEEQHVSRVEGDFNKLDFILPGMAGDGRKGQLPILYALGIFKKEYFDRHPGRYRDFTLTYVGVGNDFYSRQILNHAEALLQYKFQHFPAVSHSKALKLIKKANVSICYSLRECLPLVVFEGMTSGHPVLRNDSSGMEEQLQKDKNGYYLESKDIYQVVETFEKILNVNKTSNKKLLSMSRQSQKIVKKFNDMDFVDIEEDILDSFWK